MNMQNSPSHDPQNVPSVDPTVLDLVREERLKALSPREWKFRLRGHGFVIRDENGTQILTHLRSGETVGILPAEFA